MAQKSIPVPIGYWCGLDENRDISINVNLPAGATIEKVLTESRGKATVATVVFDVPDGEKEIARRFVFLDDFECCMSRLWAGQPENGCDAREAFSFRDLSGDKWVIVESPDFSNEVESKGLNIAELELKSQDNALERLFMVTMDGADEDQQSFEVDVTGFSLQGIAEFLKNGFHNYYRLEHRADNRTILLTTDEASSSFDDTDDADEASSQPGGSQDEEEECEDPILAMYRDWNKDRLHD